MTPLTISNLAHDDGTIDGELQVLQSQPDEGELAILLCVYCGTSHIQYLMFTMSMHGERDPGHHPVHPDQRQQRGLWGDPRDGGLPAGQRHAGHAAARPHPPQDQVTEARLTSAHYVLTMINSSMHSCSQGVKPSLLVNLSLHEEEVRQCTCGLYFIRHWLVKYKSPLVQYLTYYTPPHAIIYHYMSRSIIW